MRGMLSALVLASAGCGGVGVCDWTGTWSTDFNTMTLTQAGAAVSGSYPVKSGMVSGAVSGDHLAGTWTQTSSADPQCPSGDFEFVMAPDCGSFTGTYWYCARTSGRGSGRWNGTRK